MKERSYKIAVGGLSLSVTCFFDELGEGRRQPLSEIFDNLSNMHSHAENEIFFIWDGAMELVTESENLRFSDSAVILPPNFGHYTVIDAERVFVIYATVERAEGEVAEALQQKLSLSVLNLEIGFDEKFYLEKLAKTKNSSIRAHLLSLLFSDILSKLEPAIFDDDGGDERVGKYAFAIESYLDAHYFENVRLSDFAEHLHLCEKQVLRVLKKEYGCSFSEYVCKKRMTVAAMMLKHTDLSVREIARSVGFEADNYFYRVFKKRYGMTPTEYREKNRF